MGVLPLESLAAARETGNPVEFSHSLLTVLYPVASEWRPRLTPFIGSETWSHLPSSHHRPFPALIHSWGPSPDLEMLLLQHLSVTLALHLLCLGVTSPSLGPLALRVWLQHRPGWCVCVLFVSPQPTPHAASGKWSQAHLSAWHPPSQKPQKAFGGTQSKTGLTPFRIWPCHASLTPGSSHTTPLPCPPPRCPCPGHVF